MGTTMNDERWGILTSTGCSLLLIDFFLRQAFRTLRPLPGRGRVLVYDIITFAVRDIVLAVVGIRVPDNMSAGVFIYLVDDRTHRFQG
jgi:hypothetical protein